MIYTCTLNPSLDYQIETENLHTGTLNRVEHTAYYPGGKGINVSRVLKNLGMDTIALGFIGGFTGDFITRSLKEVGIQTDFIEHEEPTRINVKIKTNKEETEVNDQGVYVNEEHQEALLNKVNQLEKSDHLVISGSLPASVPFSIYEKLAKTCDEKGASLIIDIPSRLIKKLLKYRPFLIKPNQYELSEIIGKEINDEQDALTGAKELVHLGAKNVIVSMGRKGAILVNQATSLRAETPPGTLKNSVGSGDSLVAGFLASYIIGADIEKAFQYGVASGTATAYSDDLCTNEEVNKIFDEVLITHLKGE